MTDQEYDNLFLELKKLETENPKLINSNSPTKKYFSNVSKYFYSNYFH